ncbi:MAG: hypothetical protein QM610_10910 [Chitinophagaceae bacterium]
MKKRSMFALLAFVAVFSIGFVSCKKETYVDSSSGTYRAYVNIAPSQWTYDSQSGIYYKDVDASSILPLDFTYTVDGILMFGGPSTADAVSGVTYPINGNKTLIDGYYYYFDAAEDQTIRIYAEPVSGSSAPSTYMFFNIIFVQPEDLGELSNINTNDYLQVKKALNIKD